MAEDKDFALRALKKHWDICYEPKACVYHSHNYSIFSAFKRRFKDGISYRQVTNKSFISKNTISNYLRTYLIPEFKFIWRNYRSWFLYALSYEMTNLLGFVSGIYITSIRLILKVKQ